MLYVSRVSIRSGKQLLVQNLTAKLSGVLHRLASQVYFNLELSRSFAKFPSAELKKSPLVVKRWREEDPDVKILLQNSAALIAMIVKALPM